MSRWSSFFKFPFEGRIEFTNIGPDLFVIVLNDSSLPSYWIFKTENETYKRIDCEFEEDMPNLKNISWIGSYGNTIYMWIHGHNEANKWVDHLYRLNIDSWKFCKVMTSAVRGYFCKSAVLGDKMYIMGVPTLKNLLILDLSTKEFSSIELESDDWYYGSPIVDDDKFFLYSLPGGYEPCVVSIIDDGKIVKVYEDYWGEDESVEYEGSPFIVAVDDVFYYKYFDFKIGKWVRIEVENESLRDIFYCWQEKRNLYSLMLGRDVEYNGIRVMESQPALSTICLFNLVDEIVDEPEKEKRIQLRQETIERLPLNKRDKFVSMLDWRIRED